MLIGKLLMRIIPNLIPESTIGVINSEIDSYTDPENSRCWGSSHLQWNSNLFDDISGSCLSATPSSLILLRLRSSLIKHLPASNNISFNYHLWLKHSGINWHDDGSHVFGATLYLNEWKKEWGGLFLWEESDGLHAICPSPGTLVINTKHEPHSVTQITARAPYPRRSVQIWGKN